jgi:hypothetical protein
MCKYTQIQYRACNCKYWKLSVYCFESKRNNMGCGLYPYPVLLYPDEVKEGRCGFCQEDFEETRECGGRWFLG